MDTVREKIRRREAELCAVARSDMRCARYAEALLELAGC